MEISQERPQLPEVDTQILTNIYGQVVQSIIDERNALREEVKALKKKMKALRKKEKEEMN